MASRNVHLVVRTSGDAAELGAAIQPEIRQIDPAQPVYQVQTLDALLREHVSGTRAVAVVMALFSVLGLVLSSVGVYGVVAWSVAERTHEIGVRMALGARGSEVLTMVLRRGMLVALAGITAGTAAAYLLARALAHLVYGVAPADVAVFTAVPLLLASVALAASWIPARRAARVDPMVALRFE
jgi:putative ABC transport system permease protein